jgi:hypothetical protein
LGQACAWETDNVTDAIAKDRLEKVVAKRERESKTWVPDREAWMDRAAEIYQRERRLRKSGYIWARSLGGTVSSQKEGWGGIGWYMRLCVRRLSANPAYAVSGADAPKGVGQPAGGKVDTDETGKELARKAL